MTEADYIREKIVEATKHLKRLKQCPQCKQSPPSNNVTGRKQTAAMDVTLIYCDHPYHATQYDDGSNKMLSIGLPNHPNFDRDWVRRMQDSTHRYALTLSSAADPNVKVVHEKVNPLYENKHEFDKKKGQCSCGWKSNPTALEHWEVQWANHKHSAEAAENEKHFKFTGTASLVALLKLVLCFNKEVDTEGMTAGELLLAFTDYCTNASEQDMINWYRMKVED